MNLPRRGGRRSVQLLRENVVRRRDYGRISIYLLKLLIYHEASSVSDGPEQESGDIILTVENPLSGTFHGHLVASIHKGLAGSRGHFISCNQHMQFQYSWIENTMIRHFS
jgi:hypothetical protein